MVKLQMDWMKLKVYNDREDESLGELDEDRDWGGNLHDFKRAMNTHGVRKRRGDVDHHYKSYEGPFGDNEGDHSKSHPGKIDYSMYTEEEEQIEEDHTLARTKGHQKYGGHRNRQEESQKIS